ncbi:MAG: uroporphyrinogen decarboxylase family protein [Rectinemataceae bacterium]
MGRIEGGPRVSVDDGLGRLLERYMELHASPENLRRRQASGPSWSILPEFPLLARVTGARLRDAYLEPEAFLCFTLAQRIYRFERWRDRTSLDLDIAYWPGVILESACFGMRPLYPENQDPWISPEPIATNRGGIEGLRASFDPGHGVVGLMLEMSEFCRRELPGFTVHVQAWDRSSLGIAMDLMGAERFLVSTVEAPDLVRSIMGRVTDERRSWSMARERQLKELGFPRESSVSPGTGATSDMNSTLVNIIADEVNGPMLSPATYMEFVHPYERGIVEEAGRLNYYHSCGNLTPFLPAIAELRPMVQHISAWTDWDKAVETFAGTDTILQKTLHPLRDVIDRDEGGMEEVIDGIRATAADRVAYCIIANGIDVPNGDLEGILATCDRWVTVASSLMD